MRKEPVFICIFVNTDLVVDQINTVICMTLKYPLTSNKNHRIKTILPQDVGNIFVSNEAVKNRKRILFV